MTDLRLRCPMYDNAGATAVQADLSARSAPADKRVNSQGTDEEGVIASHTFAPVNR